MTRRLPTLVAPVLLAGVGIYLLIWVIMAPHTVYAVDYTVGGACGSTIQSCIDGASPGDTIIVPAGIWTESLTLNKAVSLTGVSSATAIIQAVTGQRVLTVTGATIDQNVIISGLTFTGGDILSGNICSDSDVSNCGGGIVLTDGARPLIQHAILEKNAAYRGGGLYANGSGALQLDHVIFRQNLATLSGGGLLAPNMPLTVTNSLFQENSTTHNVGGALAASANSAIVAPVLISNTHFISNTALCTGLICHAPAVYLFDQDSQVVNSLFQGNHCDGAQCDGGGLYLSASFNKPSLTLVNSEFVSNTAGRTGGGLSVLGQAVALNITGGRFEKNSALRANGGGLSSFAWDTIISGAHFISNSAAASTGSFLVGGGGAYVALTTTVTSARFAGNQSGLHGGGLALRVAFVGTLISDTIFIDNIAAKSGGGLSVGMQDGFSGNRSASIVNSRFEGNSANAPDNNDSLATREGGGGAWLGGASLLLHTEFLSNTAQTIGGGLHVNSDVRLFDALFQGNHALAALFPFSRGGGGLSAGGAVDLEQTRFRDNFAHSIGGGLLALKAITGTGGIFHNNHAGKAGGGLYTNGSLTISGTHFISNSAGSSGGGASANDVADIQHALFESNEAGSGGGLYLLQKGVLDNVHFIANKTITNSGGGLLVNAPVTITNSRFELNQSAGSGGGMNGSFGQVFIDGAHFLTNTAAVNGGALGSAGNISASNLLIQNNSAGNNGGGLSTAGTIWLFGSGWSIVENSAGADGGGVWANSRLVAEGGRFQGNQSGNDGGGFYGALAMLFLHGTHFADNQAGGNGGGAYSFDGRDVTGAIFEANRAGSVGGGLFLQRFAHITATQFLSNSASLGGGLAISRTNTGTTPQRIVNALFDRNSATLTGAGLYYNQPRPLAILHNSFVHPSLSPGAAVVVVTGTVAITSTIFASHTIGILQSGDAVVHEEYNLFHHNSTNVSGFVSGGLHSFDGDPRFVNAGAGNYRLALGSDASDVSSAVDALFPCLLSGDLDGLPRPGASTDFCDIGAYETQGVAAHCYATPDDGATSLYASSDGAAVQVAVDDLGASGGTVRIAGTCAGVQVRESLTQTVYVSAPVTLRGGYTTTNWNSSDPIANSTVLDAQTAGRVIYATNALTLENLRIQNGNAPGNGGGVYASATLVVTGTDLLSNRAGGDGGGIYASGGGSVAHSRFANNSSTDGRGGAIFITADPLRVANSLLVSNTARHGGALYVALRALNLLNSTLAGNHAIDSGGGISSTGDLTVTNSILWDNIPSQTGTTGNASVTRSIIKGGELGGIDQEPRFVRVPNRATGDLGDLHLLQDSPAIDAGDDARAAGLTTDLDGLPRFFDVTAIANNNDNNSANIIDMGAFEFSSQAILPTADAGGPYTGLEGSPIGLDGSGSTSVFGLVGYGWDCTDDGAFDALSSLPTGDSCPYADSGGFSVRLVVTDTGGLNDTDTAAVTVSNVAPTVTAPANQNGVEGINIFSLGFFTDPGADEPWDGVVDWGDGSVDTSFTTNVTGTLIPTSHVYMQDGAYTVTVTITDKDGAADAATFQVDVANVAPAVTPAANQTSTEGISSTFSLGFFTDPGADEPWEGAVDWGDGSVDSSFTSNVTGTLIPASHVYTQDRVYTVTVTITDKDGAADAATFQVDVANVAPAVTPAANQTATEGISSTFSLGFFTDPGADEPWEGAVDWGDGSATTLFSVPTAGALPEQPHTYALSGGYTVTVTLDDGEESGNGTFQVTSFSSRVNNPPSFTSSPLLSATVGVTYTYRITASDPDAGDLLTITAPIQPVWLAHTSTGNGASDLIGRPGAADVGEHAVVLRVADQDSLFDTQSFTVTVSPTPTSTGAVSGAVVAEGGSGVEEALVTLANDEVALRAALVRFENTGVAGAYHFDSVPTGAYSLTVEAEGYQPSDRVPVTVTKDDTTDVDPIVLQKQLTDRVYLPWLSSSDGTVSSGQAGPRHRIFLPALLR